LWHVSGRWHIRSLGSLQAQRSAKNLGGNLLHDPDTGRQDPAANSLEAGVSGIRVAGWYVRAHSEVNLSRKYLKLAHRHGQPQIGCERRYPSGLALLEAPIEEASPLAQATSLLTCSTL